MPVQFKSSLDEIHTTTLFIRHQPDEPCGICGRLGQLVSHGWVYKLNDDGSLRPVGKRVICDRRRGGTGCGRTTRFLLASETHRRHCTAEVLSAFVLCLFHGLSVMMAYGKATGSHGSRHAWRWWQCLKGREGRLRTMLFENIQDRAPAPSSNPCSARRSSPFQELLRRWIQTWGETCPCSVLQLKLQSPAI